MAEQPGDDYVIDTGKGSFNLADLGALLPGMAEIMPLVGDRIWKCYYAGRAGNRVLAAFQLKEAVNLMRKGAVLRPKYAGNIERFIEKKVAVVSQAIEAENWAAFEDAFNAMVESANHYHEFYDKGFLRWKVPGTPPPDLDMTPR
jgi:hypothetical protein